jgi:hypothetical protein
MISALLGLALAASHPPCAPSGPCDLVRPKVMRTLPPSICRFATPRTCMSGLDWISDDRRFKPAVIRFFAGTRGSYFARDEDLVWKHFWDPISGVHGKPERWGSGLYYFEACIPHHCTRNGAVLMMPGRILAATMYSDDCKRCDTVSRYIFVRRSDPNRQRWVDLIKDKIGGTHVVLLP